MANYASQAGHWYAPDGSPQYTIVGKNGKERPTTLRDARKLGLVPSVTGIIRMLAAPGLEEWKRNELLMAALTAPPWRPEVPESEWIAEIKRTATERGRAAAEQGTKIHGWIEKAFRDNCWMFDHEGSEWVVPAVDAIVEEFGEQRWQAERSFASPLGYGGKLDLHSETVLIDVKTKDFDENTKDLAYDEHAMQLAAYRMGMSFRLPQEVTCANVFVSRTNPGLVKIVIWSEEELQRGWAMFDACLRLWKLKNRV